MVAKLRVAGNNTNIPTLKFHFYEQFGALFALTKWFGKKHTVSITMVENISYLNEEQNKNI